MKQLGDSYCGKPSWDPFGKGAEACGYSDVYNVTTPDELDRVLFSIQSGTKLCFMEIKASLGSRNDLVRPTINTYENIRTFMETLK